ncbi:MAG TPA: glycosyltransferase family 2 protein [Acidimicrobiia bacterium]|nr:glycosyltransferase family 2 protein [Acidimicrobiia bacterium]
MAVTRGRSADAADLIPTRPERDPSWWARHPRAVHATSVLALLTGLVYLAWRVVWTSSGAAPETFVPLLLAEAFGWVSLACYVFDAWRIRPPVRPVLHSSPTVDVFVCTYDEPLAVLHATLAGCRAIAYPHTTWLLDDGRRPEVATLAEQMGARYMARPDNAHAKAGNINHALAHTSGELVLVLDADHVPLPDILDATLGYFEDASIALVQTPHDFYNRDSVQHSKGRRHEQTLFYEVIAPGKDRHDSMFWCGSATVIRRAALAEVGGVLTDTVAEDFHTTIALHARGWRTRYHAETLVQGLAPHDVAAFLLQRDRWARGNLRVFRTRENPVTCRGLRPAQRVSYLGSLLNYFGGLQRFVLLAVLATTLLTGRLPMTATPAGLVFVWLPWTLLAFTATIALARGRLGPADSTHYGLMTMGIFVRAVATLVTSRAGKFRVTPKQGVDQGGVHVLRALALLTTVGTVLVCAVSARIGAWAGVVPLPRLGGLALVVTLLLGAWELAHIGGVLVPLVRRRQLRHSYRFPVELWGRTGDAIARIVDLTPDGFAFEAEGSWTAGDALTLVVKLPDATGAVCDSELHAEVRSVSASPTDVARVGCRITALDDETLDRLVQYCYVVQPMRELRRTDHVRVASPAAAGVGTRAAS